MEVLSIVCQTEKKVESSGSVQMKINGIPIVSVPLQRNFWFTMGASHTRTQMENSLLKRQPDGTKKVKQVVKRVLGGHFNHVIV